MCGPSRTPPMSRNMGQIDPSQKGAPKGTRRGASLVMALVAWQFCTLAGRAADPSHAVLIELEGAAVISRTGSAAWDPAYTNQVLFPGDRLRTLERSRAVVRLSDLS